MLLGSGKKGLQNLVIKGDYCQQENVSFKIKKIFVEKIYI